MPAYLPAIARWAMPLQMGELPMIAWLLFRGDGVTRDGAGPGREPPLPALPS
jgi:hypothetical protein